jgi:hypothetical protein
MSYDLELCSSFTTRTLGVGGDRVELSVLSAVTELTLCLEPCLNNIGQL